MGNTAEHRRRMAVAARTSSVAGAGGTATLDPRLQRLVELQRDAGNGAVVQMLEEDEAAAAGGGDAGPEATEDAEDPEVVEKAKAIFENGAHYYGSGAYARAYDEFSRSFELVARPGIQFSMAQALRRLGGRREEAIELYQAYLDSGETKRAEEAKKLIAELSTPASTGDLELDTKAGKAIFEKGARLYEARDYAHAYDEFTRSYELTGRPQLLFSRAQALRRLGGRREEAIALYQAYLLKGDGNRTADANAAISELATPGSTGDLEQDTAAGRAIFNKGASYYDAGDYAHAYDEFTRSWELTERPQLLFSRAQALRRLGGRREEAIALYGEYLDKGDGKRAADAQGFIEELSTPAAE
jgi:tetratricopeptide (TPR) repeat protein